MTRRSPRCLPRRSVPPLLFFLTALLSLGFAPAASATAPVPVSAVVKGSQITLTWSVDLPPVRDVTTGPPTVTTTGGSASNTGQSSNAVMAATSAIKYVGTDTQGAVCSLSYGTSVVYGPGFYHWSMGVGMNFAYYNTATSGSATPPATFPTTNWVQGNMPNPVPTFTYAAPDTSHDITASNLSLFDSASPLCDPPPGLPAGWIVNCANIAWPLGGRNGPYTITVQSQTTSGGV